MSLIDAAKAQTVGSQVDDDTEDKAPEFKGLSKGAAYQKKQKMLRYEAALKIQTALKRGNVQLTEDEKSALELLVRKPGTGNGGGNFGKPLIYRIFGDNPKVGDKVTALEVFEKTGKGFQETKQLIRKWGEKGTVVEFNAQSKSYTIVELGNLPAAAQE